MTKDKKLFDKIGIIDTLGYNNFTNSKELVEMVKELKEFFPPINERPKIDRKQPIYYISGPIDTDGSMRLQSCLNKGYFPFRVFDVREITRLSLHEAYKQTMSSISVIAHLMDPSRDGSNSHNARAAFVCGMALAAGKHVLMLQEGFTQQPIDYRDIIVPYVEPRNIDIIIRKFLKKTSTTLFSIEPSDNKTPKGLLHKLDLGDVAAENEVQALNSYFVMTPQFQQAKQGHARLVIGRKGTGKTAIFYSIKKYISHNKDLIVLDLKPEGHQFVRLRDEVLKHLNKGLQERTMTAMWYYLLLLEIFGNIIERESLHAYQNKGTLLKHQELENIYKIHVEPGSDFSERLMTLIYRLIETYETSDTQKLLGNELIEAMYSADISILQKIIIEHLTNTDGISILFDNIDKGFSTHGLQPEDIIIVRSLLAATRKVQKYIEKKGKECKSTVFIRRDVFEHLVDYTPDRGKENYANLDWSDEGLIKKLLLARFQYEVPELSNSFDESWSQVFDPHVAGVSSIRYIIDRTFQRPRDILNFTRKCIQVAVSHGNHRVEQEDVITAEKEFSDDMLIELRYEIRDIFPELPELPLAFIGKNRDFSINELSTILIDAEVKPEQLEDVIEKLLWFSFIGIIKGEEEFYSYTYLYNLQKLKAHITKDDPHIKQYVIHPAFDKALSL